MAQKYPFKIGNDTHVWENQFITGQEIRNIPPGIPDSMDLFLKRKDQPAELIKKDQEVDLSEKGIEKFYTQEASSDAGA